MNLLTTIAGSMMEASRPEAGILSGSTPVVPTLPGRSWSGNPGRTRKNAVELVFYGPRSAPGLYRRTNGGSPRLRTYPDRPSGSPPQGRVGRTLGDLRGRQGSPHRLLGIPLRRGVRQGRSMESPDPPPGGPPAPLDHRVERPDQLQEPDDLGSRIRQYNRPRSPPPGRPDHRRTAGILGRRMQ